MKPLAEVEAILIDGGLKASGLDYAALDSVREMLSPGKSRGRGKDPETFPLPNKMAFVGFVVGVTSRVVEDYATLSAGERERWGQLVKDARELFDAVPPLDSSDWIYFELGQWGATGDRTYLSRIMDRARHRDGSGAAISSSTAALGVLQLAAFTNPAYLGIYSEMGFDPDAVKYGSNPSGRESFDALRADRELEVQTVVLDPDAGKPETRGTLPASLLQPSSIPVGGGDLFVGVGADSSAGSIQTPFGVISITAALQTIAALTVATRQLLLPLPYEGYQWDDFAGSDMAPASILFTLDVFEGERLKLFQPNPLNALFIAGRVVQEGLNYVPSIFDAASGMFMPLGGRLPDLNLSKFMVASRLKSMLAAGGATPSGSPPPPTAAEAAAVQVASQTIVAPAAVSGAAAPVLNAPAGSSSAASARSLTDLQREEPRDVNPRKKAGGNSPAKAAGKSAAAKPAAKKPAAKKSAAKRKG